MGWKLLARFMAPLRGEREIVLLEVVRAKNHDNRGSMTSSSVQSCRRGESACRRSFCTIYSYTIQFYTSR